MNDEEVEELFKEHWTWFESIIRHLCHDWFIHGIKHGQEIEKK